MHVQTWVKIFRFLLVFMYIGNKLSQKGTQKYRLSSLEFSVVLILKTDWFPIFPSTVFQMICGKSIRFQKAVPLICDTSLPLYRWPNIWRLTYVLLTLPWGIYYQWNRFCQKQLCTVVKNDKLSGKYLSWSLRTFS